jgi:hypothetical protein
VVAHLVSAVLEESTTTLKVTSGVANLHLIR